MEKYKSCKNQNIPPVDCTSNPALLSTEVPANEFDNRISIPRPLVLIKGLTYTENKWSLLVTPLRFIVTGHISTNPSLT